MNIDKRLLSGGTTLLLLKLLESTDMYGYQMIGELAKQSNNTFDLKAGTLYPILHRLEKDGALESYEESDGNRTRKFYHLTKSGHKLLKEKKEEWTTYESAVNQVLGGGILCERFA